MLRVCLFLPRGRAGKLLKEYAKARKAGWERGKGAQSGVRYGTRKETQLQCNGVVRGWEGLEGACRGSHDKTPLDCDRGGLWRTLGGLEDPLLCSLMGGHVRGEPAQAS